MVSPYHKKEIVIKVRQKLSCSERKACKLLDFNRQTIRYKSKKRADEDKLKSDIIGIAAKYHRFGYRRITSVLHDKGWKVNKKRVLRICNEEGLTVPRKQKKIRKIYTNDGSCTRLKALYPNHIWSYDFVHDTLANRNKYRILTIIDEFSRKCLRLAVGKEFKASHVIEVLAKLFKTEGQPMYLRSDNGSEFRSKNVQNFLGIVGVKPLYITPGSPWENGFNERFNGTLRDECLKGEIFYSLKEAQIMLDRYQVFYNTQRPHSSLGYKVPCPEGL